MSAFKIGDICEITSSKRIYANEYKEFGIPFYRGKEIIEKANNKSIKSELYITEEKYQEIISKYSVPSVGDILMTAVGTLGVSYMVKNEKFYFKDGNVIWFKNFKKDLINNKYLYYFFNSEKFMKTISEISIGSTQKAITIDSLKKIDIDIPMLDSQQHIVDIIVL